MKTSDKARQRIATQLKAAMATQGINYTALVAQTGHDLRIIGNAISYGIAETVDLIDICQALKLDPVVVIRNAMYPQRGDSCDIITHEYQREILGNWTVPTIKRKRGEAPLNIESTPHTTGGMASAPSAEQEAEPWHHEPAIDFPDPERLVIAEICGENIQATYDHEAEAYVDDEGSTWNPCDVTRWRDLTQAETDALEA